MPEKYQSFVCLETQIIDVLVLVLNQHCDRKHFKGETNVISETFVKFTTVENSTGVDQRGSLPCNCTGIKPKHFLLNYIIYKRLDRDETPHYSTFQSDSRCFYKCVSFFMVISEWAEEGKLVNGY